MTAKTEHNGPADSPDQPPVPRTILVVEDDPTGRETLAEGVAEMGYRSLAAADAPTALRLLENEPVELVLTDLRMPGMDGLELLQAIRRHDAQIFVILVTAYASIQNAVEAMKLGAFSYVQKPINLDEIAVQVQKALKARDLAVENVALRQRLHSLGEFPEMVGHSAAMRQVFDLIAQVADSESTVLIRGESGTGKELAANAIHHRSPRADRPFVKVNCSALTETLLESELFGHEEGAFTGATRQKPGRFELADGGSIFLDEISELSAATQAKLLRVLQNFEFERVGGTETLRVDVRVIAATNTDLEARVEEGEFRQDLYYRLNVVPLVMPPLRERREDIPLLVHHFIRRFAERNRREVDEISHEALQTLMQHDWPGNVRELENCIERMVVTSRTRVLDVDDLPPEVLPPAAPSAASFPVGLTMAQVEERAIRETLAHTGGNRSEAARVLDIGLRTLHRKIQRYGIERVRKPKS
jgi:two-component system response regulator HydG